MYIVNNTGDAILHCLMPFFVSNISDELSLNFAFYESNKFLNTQVGSLLSINN